MTRWIGLALMVALAAPGGERSQRPIFRADTSMVFVDVSVKKGNTPVPGLQAPDFVLLDNGVRQTISAVAIAGVPLDVSLFLDTSGSTASALATMKTSVKEIAAMLRAGDRLRLLTIGLSVHESLPWTPAGAPMELDDLYPVQGISLIYDALYAASAHAVEAGRRHLVVALTDGLDECSVVGPDRLLELVGRTEAVVHWVPLGSLGTVAHGAAQCDRQSRPRDGGAALDALVKGTGGAKHTGFLGMTETSPVKAFRRVLDDYRQSYVLSYVPEGVARNGWHTLNVTVPAQKYSIRARAGYLGD